MLMLKIPWFSLRTVKTSSLTNFFLIFFTFLTITIKNQTLLLSLFRGARKGAVHALFKNF